MDFLYYFVAGDAELKFDWSKAHSMSPFFNALVRANVFKENKTRRASALAALLSYLIRERQDVALVEVSWHV